MNKKPFSDAIEEVQNRLQMARNSVEAGDFVKAKVRLTQSENELKKLYEELEKITHTSALQKVEDKP